MEEKLSHTKSTSVLPNIAKCKTLDLLHFFISVKKAYCIPSSLPIYSNYPCRNLICIH